jgi:hypothetical protein
VRTILEGVERFTVELTGKVDPSLADLLPRDVEAERDERDGSIRVGVLVFAMQGLRARGLPGPRLDYGEALFRVAVRHRGAPAWLAVACDLDNALVRATGERLIRYPVRRARIAIDGTRVAVEAREGTLAAEVVETAERVIPEPTRVVLSRRGDTLYRIPWEEVPPPDPHVARVRIVTDTLSAASFGVPARYDERGVGMQGRVHRCGLAVEVTGR